MSHSEKSKEYFTQKFNKKVMIPLIAGAAAIALAAGGFCVYWFGIRCEHEYDEGTVTTEATCVDEGVVLKKCIHCGSETIESVAPTGRHILSDSVTREATCSQKGEITKKCSICEYSEVEEVPMVPHTYEIKITKKSTCKEYGLEEEICKECGAKGKSEKLKLTEHRFEEKVTKEAACTVEGELTNVCSVCGKTQTEVISATGHQWGNWNVDKEATFETTGKQTRNCIACGISESETIPVRVLTEDDKYQMALEVAQEIVASLPAGSDYDRIAAAAKIVGEYSQSCTYTSDGDDYYTSYGVFVKGEYTCAGSTRAMGMVLECMGYEWEHVNENEWAHQWCRFRVDGKQMWADGQIGMVGYGKHFVEE